MYARISLFPLRLYACLHVCGDARAPASVCVRALGARACVRYIRRARARLSHHVTLRPGRVTAPQRGDALSGHWSVESSTDLPCRRRRVLPATPTTSELRTSVRAELRRDDDVTSTAICYKLPSTDLLSDRAPGAVDRSKRRKHLVQADRCQMSPVHFQAANSDYDDVKISDERINETADSKVKYYVLWTLWPA